MITMDFGSSKIVDFLRQSKDKVFVFKMHVDLAGSGVDLVKHMQCGGNMENLWVMFDHVKILRDWTTMACHIYDNKYCKVLTITCCDMHLKNVQAKLFFVRISMLSCWRMVSSMWISNVSWQTMLKLIGLPWGRFTVIMTLLFCWGSRVYMYFPLVCQSG